MTRRRWLVVLLLVTPSLHAGEPRGLGTVLSPNYVDPRHLTLIRFGEIHSHYLRPWRAYLETVPASRFLNGIGVGMPGAGQYHSELICRMLAEHGFTCGRVEIGWGNLNYDDETRINGADRLRELLAAMGRHGIRPLILLNAHQGVPCPLRFFEHTVTKDAVAGDRTLVLDRVDDLQLGYSGPCDLSNYWAAEAIVTAVEGTTASLSKPLPKAIAAGTRQRFATLKYRPFSQPDSPDYQATIAGWQRYVRTVATFVAEALGSTGTADLGFDLEVWNELTFGTEFLYLNHYYDPQPVDYEERSIWDNLVAATASELDSQPDLYRGVTLVNGFGNTIPWTASSLQPKRVGGICKHPYAGPQTFPGTERRSHALGAQGQPDDFVPSYLSHFPEYFASAIQTETMCRDLAPFTTDIYQVIHGRQARTPEQGGPCPVWITEVNFIPAEHRGVTDPAESMRLKAKAALRYFCFFLNKGVEKLFLYNACGHDRPELDFATLSGAFVDYAKSHDTWPANADAIVSPQLRAVSRVVQVMRDGLDPNLTATRPVGVASITDEHGHYQFAGDGTPAHPPLYNREVLAVLPYQVNRRRFVIPIYVMTRDMLPALRPEAYTITLTGLHGDGARLRWYDPVTDTDASLTAVSATGNALQVRLEATDTPRLLIVNEP